MSTRGSFQHRYSSLFPITERSVPQMLDDAEKAVEAARAARKLHARRSKRDSKQRQVDLRVAKERVSGAMKPIRKKLAKRPYEKINVDAYEQLKEASDALQRERRKLWKMTKPLKRSN